MNILVFSFFPAFVPPSNGGVSRLYNFYKSVSKWHQVTLLSSTHQGVEEEIIYHGSNFTERRIAKGPEYSTELAKLSNFSDTADLSGPCIAACSKYPTLLHQAYLEEYAAADIIIHDSPFTIDYDLFAGVDNKLRVYNAYNCETLLYDQMHNGEGSSQIYEIVKSSEARLLDAADLLMFCSHEDLLAFSTIAPSAKYQSVYVPNGMTSKLLSYPPTEQNKNIFSAVFMGSSHPPNIIAANFIVENLAPALPQIDFHIIGSCLPKGRYPKNIIRHGIVDDEVKAKLLRFSDIALNPMASGSGSNVKVLDYFSYALPVLSTPFGMRGISAESDKHYLDSSFDQFYTSLLNIMNQRDRLKEIGLAAQELGLEKYTWDTIARFAVEKLETMQVANIKKDNQIVLALNDYDSYSATGGGCTRTRGLYEAVSVWSRTVFLCFSATDQLSARWDADGVRVITVPKTSEHLDDQIYINSHFHVSADDIVASRHVISNPWLVMIYKYLREQARCIVAEHCYMVPLPMVFGDRFVYSSQNNETDLKTRLLDRHPFKDSLLEQVKRIEREAIQQSAAVIAVSEEDAECHVRGKQTAGPVIVVRNGAAAPESGTALEAAMLKVCSKIKKESVLFLGSAHLPNVDAARYIVEHVAPKCPKVQFHLIGSVCDDLGKVPENVCLWGVLNDAEKSAVMQSCALAVNPMLSGSGSNVKLADYLGHGLYVVSTEFGLRGYPTSIADHVFVAPAENFIEAIHTALKQPKLFAEDVRMLRRALFDRDLSMTGIARKFVSTLQNLEKKKKRVLYVTYRYISPSLGGAEVNVEKFVRALGESGQFDVDIISPEISGIHSYMRFNDTYTFDPACSAPIDIPNVRFARFPADVPDQLSINKFLQNAWRVQPRFEKEVNQQLSSGYIASGLTWGWDSPQGIPGHATRWAMVECGLFLVEAAQVKIVGYSPSPAVVSVTSQEQVVGGPWSVDGDFCLEFEVKTAGNIQLDTSIPALIGEVRPIAFHVTALSIAGVHFDLASPTLPQQYLPAESAKRAFEVLDQAAAETRVPNEVRLTNGRGPWSASMEHFIIDHVSDYDLVVTHNNVFRPAVIAIQEAKKNGIPSILIPHVHLDDDFYHFPDLLESARDADLVLAVPKAACEFLANKGCNVKYLPAGCDTEEIFSQHDVESFRDVFQSKRPFILVLGRKAGAKGYRKIIDAVEQLNQDGVNLHVVLIGPDDDGLSVNSQNATYLGHQPRDVVRGGLMSCIALCNMSTSESFGIVLLEAWQAGKPVIVNKNCVAFHDMAVDGENALMVSEYELQAGILSLVTQPILQARIAIAGRAKVEKFSWRAVSANFVKICSEFTL